MRSFRVRRINSIAGGGGFWRADSCGRDAVKRARAEPARAAAGALCIPLGAGLCCRCGRHEKKQARPMSSGISAPGTVFYRERGNRRGAYGATRTPASAQSFGGVAKRCGAGLFRDGSTHGLAHFFLMVPRIETVGSCTRNWSVAFLSLITLHSKARGGCACGRPPMRTACWGSTGAVGSVARKLDLAMMVRKKSPAGPGLHSRS